MINYAELLVEMGLSPPSPPPLYEFNTLALVVLIGNLNISISMIGFLPPFSNKEIGVTFLLSSFYCKNYLYGKFYTDSEFLSYFFFFSGAGA